MKESEQPFDAILPLSLYIPRCASRGSMSYTPEATGSSTAGDKTGVFHQNNSRSPFADDSQKRVYPCPWIGIVYRCDRQIKGLVAMPRFLDFYR